MCIYIISGPTTYGTLSMQSVNFLFDIIIRPILNNVFVKLSTINFIDFKCISLLELVVLFVHRSSCIYYSISELLYQLDG